MLWNTARIFAQVTAKEVTGAQARDAQARNQERAIQLIGRALELLPKNQRVAFWKKYIQPDTALAPIRGTPSYVRLEANYAASKNDPSK